MLETWVASALAPRPPRLLVMGKQTFYLITALPSPRPPTRSPLPAQPLTPQTQCVAVASPAPATLRLRLAWGAAPTCLHPFVRRLSIPRSPSLHRALLAEKAPPSKKVLRGEGTRCPPRGLLLAQAAVAPGVQRRGNAGVKATVHHGQEVPVAGSNPPGKQSHYTPHSLPPHPSLPHVLSHIPRHAGEQVLPFVHLLWF